VDRPPAANLGRRKTAAYIESMKPTELAVTQMSDGDLVSAATRLATEGRQATADLIALLVELGERKVYAQEGYSSIFGFCVGRLRLSEEEAFYRIAAGRVASRFPVVLERLREGRLTLTNVALLRKVLTEENHGRLLEAAEGRSKREVQALVARLAPRPDLPVSIRKLAAPRAAAHTMPGGSDRPAADVLYRAAEDYKPVPPLLADAPAGPVQVAPAVPSSGSLQPVPGAVTPQAPALCAPPPQPKPASICPLAPSRYSLRLTISEETHGKLRRALDLFGHTVPAGDTAAVIDRALTLLIAHLERTKYAAKTPRPQRGTRTAPAQRRSPQRTEPEIPAPLSALTARSLARTVDPSRPAATRRSRYIPAAVRRAVWLRDGGRCAFVAANGHRCEEASRLEFHHKVPFADGGQPTPANVELRCTLCRYRHKVHYADSRIMPRRRRGPTEIGLF